MSACARHLDPSKPITLLHASTACGTGWSTCKMQNHEDHVFHTHAHCVHDCRDKLRFDKKLKEANIYVHVHVHQSEGDRKL